ncbi:MAG TPA: NADH-quinone oxidoreductase subunit J [Candidatus Limnocylindria bacterium]|nr:NADH-quinone oxidoreductase subunit J [Candidatus Limnocylindria bacterium]
MSAEQGIFAVAGGICVVSAANAVLRRDALTSALSLTVTLFSLAVLYLGLGAPYLAGVQVAVYAGAIMVLLVFVIMLLGAGRVAPPRVGRPALTGVAVLLATALFAVLVSAIARGGLASSIRDEPVAAPDHVAALGALIFGRYLVAFEVTSVLLLAALIAAVVMARKRASGQEWPA